MPIAEACLLKFPVPGEKKVVVSQRFPLDNMGSYEPGGSVLIFCVGLNLVWGKKVRVANMLPAVIFAVAAAYLPWAF